MIKEKNQRFNIRYHQSLADQFLPYRVYYNFDFANDLIICPCEFDSINNLFGIAFGFFVPLALCFVSMRFFPGFPKQMYQLFGFLVPIVGFVVKKVCVNIYRVIDYKNKYFITNIYFLGCLCGQINRISFDNIIEVGNDSSIPSNRKVDELSKYDYKVSLLLKNGKIYKLFTLGDTREDYQRSLEMAEILAEYLNVPLAVCRNDYHLKSVLTFSGYKFALKDNNDPGFLANNRYKTIKWFLAVCVALAIFFGTLYLIDLYFEEKKPKKNKYDYDYRYDYKYDYRRY